MPQGIKPSPEASISSGVAHFRMTHLNRREVVMVAELYISLSAHISDKKISNTFLFVNWMKLRSHILGNDYFPFYTISGYISDVQNQKLERRL